MLQQLQQDIDFLTPAQLQLLLATSSGESENDPTVAPTAAISLQTNAPSSARLLPPVPTGINALSTRATGGSPLASPRSRVRSVFSATSLPGSGVATAPALQDVVGLDDIDQDMDMQMDAGGAVSMPRMPCFSYSVRNHQSPIDAASQGGEDPPPLTLSQVSQGSDRSLVQQHGENRVAAR
jgi:hypothetical protein